METETVTEPKLGWYHDPALYELLSSKNCELRVLHEDGLYRHLRFQSPDTTRWWWWWELVTWPGSLAINASAGGGFVFTGAEDMLLFSDQGQPDGYINADWWAEKLVGGSGLAKEVNVEKFHRWLRQRFDDGSFDTALRPLLELDQLSRVVFDIETALDILAQYDLPWEDEDADSWMQYKERFLLALHMILWGAKKYQARSEK